MEQQDKALHLSALQVLCEHQVLRACDKHPDQYFAGDRFLDVDAQSSALLELWSLDPNMNTGELTGLYLDLRRTYSGSGCQLCDPSAE